MRKTVASHLYVTLLKAVSVVKLAAFGNHLLIDNLRKCFTLLTFLGNVHAEHERHDRFEQYSGIHLASLYGR